MHNYTWKIPSMCMHFIVIDLKGFRFKPLPQGHQYTLTVIDMLTNYTCCIPLVTKEPDRVVQAYLVNVYSQFDGSQKILSDNGPDFKNKFFAQVSSTLGMKQLLSSSYYP